MRNALARSLALVAVTVITTQIASGQEPAPYDAKAGVMLMRMINTAENAEHRNGRYAALEQLLVHPMMTRVTQSVTFNGSEATYLGQMLRLVVSADGQRYQVALVPPSGVGIAFFTDERGLIYSGKVID